MLMLVGIAAALILFGVAFLGAIAGALIGVVIGIVGAVVAGWLACRIIDSIPIRAC